MVNDNVVIALSIEKPFMQTSRRLPADMSEQRGRSHIVYIDHSIKLMQVKHTKRIVSNLTNDFNGIAITSELINDD